MVLQYRPVLIAANINNSAIIIPGNIIKNWIEER